MGIRSRKLYVWIISLAAVLAIYLLYSRMSKTPKIAYDKHKQSTRTVPDANVSEFTRKIGKVGKFDIGKVRKARYEHRDPKTKKIDRVFGFQEVLHETGDEWEIKKPYMNIFQRTFKCYITAERGNVHVESATPTSQPTPKDATLTGNVVIRILPGESGDIKESFVYLDDIDFISEMSLFSTPGPVKFVNEDAQMLGRGLELVYNEGLGRLEFLRIIHLESLSLKIPSKEPLVSSKQKTDLESSDKPPSDLDAPDVAQKTQPAPLASKEKVEQKEGEYYRCVFSKNVFIDTPDQLVFTDKFSINNIFWQKSSSTPPAKTDTPAPDSSKHTDASVNNQTEPSKTDAEDVGSPNTPKLTVPEESEPNKSPEEFVEVLVTCDDGILIVPMDSKKTYSNFALVVARKSIETSSWRPENLEEADGRAVLVAPNIDYCAATGDAVAAGPVQLTFYPEQITAVESNEPNGAIVPVKVTAQKQATFSPGLNQAIFEGNCLCTMPRGDPNAQQDYTLSSPRLIVNLPKDTSQQPSASPDIFAAGPVELTFYVDVNDVSATGSKETALPAKIIAHKQAKFLSAQNQVIFEGDTLCTMLREDPNFRQQYTLSAPRITVNLPKDHAEQELASAQGIEHLTADGGLVRLSTIKTATQRNNTEKEPEDPSLKNILSGIELKCLKFDFDNAEQSFLATGPGVIKFYNSSKSHSEPNSDAFSLQKPSYAFVEHFDTLKYLSEPNLIIADAAPQGTLLISYFPIVDGQIRYDQWVTSTAGHIEVLLVEAPDAQTELSTLSATGGITYEDGDKRFVGSELFYDYNKSLITVYGDLVQPCLLNGALVDSIEYDLITGRVKAQVPAPGAFQLRR